MQVVLSKHCMPVASSCTTFILRMKFAMQVLDIKLRPKLILHFSSDNVINIDTLVDRLSS